MGIVDLLGGSICLANPCALVVQLLHFMVPARPDVINQKMLPIGGGARGQKQQIEPIPYFFIVVCLSFLLFATSEGAG